MQEPARKNLQERTLGPDLFALLLVVVFFLTVFLRSLFPIGRGGVELSIPFDFDDTYHRFAVYISRCLRDLILPLWDPFTACGNPFFLNPQTSLWWPVTWMVSLIFGYDHDVAQRQAITTILAGGIGIYVLTRRLCHEPRGSFLSAACFISTSAVFGNMEHWDIINAICHAPYLFLAALSAGENKKSGFLWVSVVVASLIVSGYPGLVIMQLAWLTAYGLHAIWISSPILACKIRRGVSWLSAALLAGGLSAAHWLPIVRFSPEISRGRTLPPLEAMANSLTANHLWGLISFDLLQYPFAGETLDVSMRGLYFGVTALPLVCLSLVHVRTEAVTLLATLMFSSLALGLGSNLFLTYDLHDVIPLFNLSRFPSGDNRGLFIFSAIILAGIGLEESIVNFQRARQFLLSAYKILSLLVLFPIIALSAHFQPNLPITAFFAVIVAGLTMQLFFIGLATCIILRGSVGGASQTATLLSLLVALDAGTGLYRNYALVGAALPHAQTDVRLTSVQGFSGPGELQRHRQPGTLEHPHAYYGYTDGQFYVNYSGSFVLKKYVALTAEPDIVDWLEHGDRLVFWENYSRDKSAARFLEEKSRVPFEIVSFAPTRIEYRVNVSAPGVVVQNEIFFPGWRTYMDGKLIGTQQIIGGLRGFSTDAGAHQVVQVFRPTVVYLGMLISLCSAILCLTLALQLRFDRNKGP